ncbi:MAG: leucyl aminopeptidase [Lachnospiraceae bacterium]|nr:leucyl aminopeptidase [Lachnospiraceae bacterium]
MTERFELARERIQGMQEESFAEPDYAKYFRTCAEFAGRMCELYDWIGAGNLKTAALEELQARNRMLYEELFPENYENSFLNPAYAVGLLGEEMGRLLSGIYAKIRGMISACYARDLENLVIYLELFIEVYCRFREAQEEGQGLPEPEEIQQIYYWFVSDYADVFTQKRIREQLDPKACFAADIVRNADLTDLRYLYAYGVYVSENELGTARYMNGLSQEKIQLLADTYTEGYRMGFELAGKDLGKKKTAGVYYNLGFERMMRQAFENFEKLGLSPVVPGRNAYGSKSPNRQYEYDHKDDQALILDKAYVNRELDVLRTVYEENKELAGGYAGPAVLEVFGEEPFAPASKPQACVLNEKQQQLSVEYVSASREIQRQYILPEERSFTIIAFPIPEIGDKFEEIFDQVVRINTLDYQLYQRIQQTMIDVLDQASYVEVKGMKGNRTDLTIALHELGEPKEETLFENCVADVNIPVGEVFTSPRLAGTNGVLHVSRVFLNELEYKDLSITFQDGMIADYSCANFDTLEENRRYIKDNVLYHQDTLPMGEFAIGTNTTAYVAAAKYDIGSKLPILIAEKMGPHFAVGDTCYSHEEDLITRNPDGKKIVARENEVSARRKEPGAKAYFNCHTDITIPYDELGELTAVCRDQSRVKIIENGRFVLQGCEELNKPFEE